MKHMIYQLRKENDRNSNNYREAKLHFIRTYFNDDRYSILTYKQNYSQTLIIIAVEFIDETIQRFHCHEVYR